MKKILTTLLVFSASFAMANSNPYTVESAIYRVEVPSIQTATRWGSEPAFLSPETKILTNCHVLQNILVGLG